MKLKHHKLTFAISLACASGVHAQTATLPEVVVTANPVVEEIRVDPFSSTSAIVTEDQLRDLNAVDLASALRNTPGVEISRYDPVGSYSGNQGGAVYIRGMGASRPGSEIKTYIDGIPVYMGVWDHPLLDLLPINAMQSITVYKSPQPQINGNNFASINLETKRPTEDGIHGSATVSAGSFGTVVEQGDLSVRQNNLDFMLTAGHAQSDGQRPNADGNLSNVMGRMDAKLSDIWSVGISFLSVDNVTHDPGSDLLPAPAIAPRNDSDTHMVTAFVKHQSGDWSGEFRVYNNNGDNNLYNDLTWGTFLSHFNMSGVRWKEQFSPWTGGTVVAGIDQDSVSGAVNGPFTGGWVNMPTFRVTSPYVAVSQKIDLSKDWTLVPSIGIRNYEHNQYQSETAPFGGVSLVSDRVTVFANASRGILYPGLEGPGLQAALPFLFAGTTWQQLAPETDDHKEIGVKLSPTETTQIDISLFQDAVQNRYVYNLVYGAGTFYNFGSYRTNGVELSVRQKLSRDWRVFAGLTLLDSSLSTLPYAPKKAITVGLNGKIGPVGVVVDAQYQSKVWALSLDRNALDTTTEQVGAFTIVNARLSYPVPGLGKKGEIFAAVENLFNRTYAYQPGYPMPGIGGRIGVSASF